MQLNSKTSEKILSIQNINCFQHNLNSQIMVSYKLNECYKHKETEFNTTSGSVFLKIDVLQVLVDTSISVEENLYKCIYNGLVKLPEFSDFEISLNSLNWKYQNRGIRLTIPNDLIVNSLAVGNQLGQIFNTVTTHLRPYIYKSENCTIVYLEEIYTGDLAIIESYPEIYIEYK